MNLKKTVPTIVVLACLLVILANAPAILVDPVATAVLQIRKDTVKTVQPNASLPVTENPYPEETLGQKKTK